MAGLGRTALVVSVSRIFNYGLMIVSPIILVRYLSVAEFGRYREFLVYASLLQSFAAFSLNDSLLYFVPRYSESKWRVVRQTALLGALFSVVVALLVVAADIASHGSLVGSFRYPLVCYLLTFGNVDFWESLWLSEHRPIPVLAYTAGRLLARMLVVVGVTVLTADVNTIIWSLVALELSRLAIAAFLWRRADRSSEESRIPRLWHEQLRFCIPAGVAVLLAMANRNLGNLVVTKMLGVVFLAYFTIGTYGEPIVYALRNSISTVLLPELVKRSTAGPRGVVALWQRATVMNCILLFPAAILLVRYADIAVVTVFGQSYVPAIPVLQWYAVIMLRECFDFSPLLRAFNYTKPLVHSNLLALAMNAIGLFLFVPKLGLLGAILAWILGVTVDAVFLSLSAAWYTGVSLPDLMPWSSILRVGAAAVLAAVVVISDVWTSQAKFLGAIAAGAIYGIVYVLLMYFMRVQELMALIKRLTWPLKVRRV